ncbi:YncE family protein [Desulfurivibrio alkaliphilus]|uniref:YncE family protein n=1 Tax=Desulfurivibrio alkaliphilus (strain DSM 19089 / UNIQEM U267 / AHT2) TaxID=589865 RepID=D6YZU2_DESAT|nr:YncE family protein [Desulfurivibrio alkaliphilus]ADH85099.1 conserved hypothetical protein [Desulfurivibrio alkaliphilus AHT 2]
MMDHLFPSPLCYRAAGHRLLLLALLIMLLPGQGCRPEAPPLPRLPEAVERHPSETARLSFFLTLADSTGPSVRVVISELAILADQHWVTVTDQTLTLESAQIAAGQLFLGARAAVPGRYQRLRFTVERVEKKGPDGSYQVLAAETFPVEQPLPAPLTLESKDSRSLFISWDVEATLQQENFAPVFTLAEQVTPLLADLAYVACPDIDTIFVIRTDRGWVADSFGLPGSPSHLALDNATDQERLLVLAPGEMAVKLVDLSSQRVIDQFHLPLTSPPTFMTTSPDGRWAYILEEQSGYLSRLDLETGHVAARVRLEHQPLYAAWLPDQQWLAVAVARSQAVLLLTPRELNPVRTIPTGNAPQGLLAAAGQLYITERRDHTVLVYDLNTNQPLARLEAGLEPRRLLATDNHVYVSNHRDGTITVIAPGLPGVIREIRGLGRPLEMIYDPSRRQVLVGEEETGGVAVIDAANRLRDRIIFGARPAGMVMMP